MMRQIASGLAAACLMFAIAPPAATEAIHKVNPPGVAAPLGHYSHVATVPPGTKLLYLAGQIGIRPDGSLPGSIEDQTIQAYENVRAILAAEGATPADIVFVKTYRTKRPTDPGPMQDHRRRFFQGTPPPPGTLVYVSELARPDILVEIEVVAAVSQR
jgi:enamine deaminase RidA (YjgF/YER057c/UK114 family)